jgi:hypothetical protein
MPIASMAPPGALQTFEGTVAAVAQGLHVLRRRGAVLVGADVVDIKNVDACQAKAQQAVLEQAHDAVVRIVADDVER